MSIGEIDDDEDEEEEGTEAKGSQPSCENLSRNFLPSVVGYSGGGTRPED